MKKHRLLSCAVSLSLALSSVSAFALSFNDVENDPTVSWAKSAITEMTEAGYIKGYEDGSFKPYRAISKMECLLLMSRILGVEEKEYAEIAAAAKSMYGSTAAKYNNTYTNELCFLLYTGVLTESDLVDYASAANANTELLRYQAAILMAKLLGANTEAKSFTAAKATYADDAKIPANAKPYVEYVTRQGIMNGMDKDANGNPQFSPTTSLTRAQVATLLNRMIDKIDKMTYTGTIDALDLDKNLISIDREGDVSKRTLNADTVAREDGKSLSLSKLQTGSEVAVIEVAGHVQLIDVLGQGSGDGDKAGTVVYAKIAAMSENSNGKRMTLADTEDSENTASYDVASNCTFTINGAKGNFNSLKKNDFVKVTVSNGKIVAVSVEDKDLTVSGTLTQVEFDDDDHVYLYVADKNGENEQQYVVSNLGATVTRDGNKVEYRELSAGDSVKLQLTSGKVTKVTAVSSSERFTGVLTEIILATQPSVTIRIDGKEKNYKLRSDARILISGEEATIYDLRPNITVSGTLDSSEIKSLSASSVSTNEKGEITGTVMGVNTGYKVITVKDEKGNTQSVYYNSRTTFLKSSGDTTTSKSLEKGTSVSITGAESNGVFEATIVIIK